MFDDNWGNTWQVATHKSGPAKAGHHTSG